MKHNQKTGTVFVLLSAVTFSLAGILIKIIDWSPITINGVRSIFAAAVMLIYLKATRHRIRCNKTIMFAAVCNVVMNLTYVFATKITSAANAVVLQFTMPIFIIIFSVVFLKKKPQKAEIVTCITVFAGIVCFFFDGLTARGMLGNILAIISGATYAVVFMQKAVPNSDFESSALFGQLMSIVISIPFWFFESSFTFTDIWATALLGTVQMGISYVLLSVGLTSVSPITASLTSTIEPILNPVIVAIFYHEHIGTLSFIGAAAVIGSVAVYNVLKASDKEKSVQNPGKADASI